MKKGRWQRGMGVAEALLLAAAVAALALLISSRCGAWDEPNDTWIGDEYVGYCEEIGYGMHVSPELLEAIIEVESSGQEDAVSPTGCVGLMQVDPRWHKERMERLGCNDLADPYQNITVGTDYLLELFEEHGEMDAVLREYGGWSGEDGDRYVQKIIDRAHHLETVHEKRGCDG